jgi:BarA-like signal transduction histidine kinase
MPKKDYTPAEAVKLYVGDLEFDAIRIIETSEYRMSQSQVLKAISVAKYYLARLPYHAPDKAQRLANKGFTWVSLAVKYHDGKQSFDF